jgi:guanyl-specific ribonuclease Sa
MYDEIAERWWTPAQQNEFLEDLGETNHVKGAIQVAKLASVVMAAKYVPRLLFFVAMTQASNHDETVLPIIQLMLPPGKVRGRPLPNTPQKMPAWINIGDLPAAERLELESTLNEIKAGRTPTDARSVKWGDRFKNWAGDLPGASGPASPYREYRVTTPGSTGAGIRRVVVDPTNDQYYYTWTHYGTATSPTGPPFVRIQ